MPVALSWLFFVYAAVYPQVANTSTLALIVSVVALYALVALSVLGPSQLSFAVVYGAYLSLSHLGLAGIEAAYPGSVDAFGVRVGHGTWVYEPWFYHPSFHYGVIVASLGVTSYFVVSLSYALFKKFQGRYLTLGLDTRGDQRLYWAGIAFLTLSIAYLVISLTFGDLNIVDDYSSYFGSTAAVGGYSTFLLLLAIGVTFSFATGGHRQLVLAGILFSLPSAVLLAAGSRGAVLYAVAAVTGILGSRGLRLRPVVVAAALLVLFVLIPVVRQVRSVAANERALSAVELNPTDPFLELGFQIRPLVHTLRWIQEGEDYAYGGTYWLPVQRALGLILPIDRPLLEGNRFNFGERLPGFGYSVIAEAFFNFGLVGVILVPSLVGYIASMFGYAPTSRRLALYGALMQVLINNQRNAFIFVPGQIIVILTIYFAVTRLIKVRSLERLYSQ